MNLARPCLTLTGLLLVVTCAVYPALVTGVAQAAFPGPANGSLVVRDGKVVGSSLLGQSVGRPSAQPDYLWGRPSAGSADKDTGLFVSGGSNYGPLNGSLADEVAERVKALRDTGVTGPIPADLVTKSASGLDPHISPAAAEVQVPRVAAASGISPRATVRDAHPREHASGIDASALLGDPRVDVLAREPRARRARPAPHPAAPAFCIGVRRAVRAAAVEPLSSATVAPSPGVRHRSCTPPAGAPSCLLVRSPVVSSRSRDSRSPPCSRRRSRARSRDLLTAPPQAPSVDPEVVRALEKRLAELEAREAAAEKKAEGDKPLPAEARAAADARDRRRGEPDLEARKAAEAKKKAEDEKSAAADKVSYEGAVVAPFGFADFSWVPGNYGSSDRPFKVGPFTGEFRADTVYHYEFSHPKDDTISGSSEVFRSNEFQVTQLGFGGDFFYKGMMGRMMTQFGMYSTTTARNDASPSKGQWDLADAYRYISEAYAGYHFDVMNGINIEAGIFMSYIGLWSYYNFDNWTYQPSYVSSNTPWFFNGMRVQIFPSEKLKTRAVDRGQWLAVVRQEFNQGAQAGNAGSLASNLRTIWVLGNPAIGAPTTLGNRRAASACTPTTASWRSISTTRGARSARPPRRA